MFKRIFCAFALLLSSAAVAVDLQWPLLPDHANKMGNTSPQAKVFYYYYLNEDYQAAANQLNILQSLSEQAEQEKKDELDLLNVSLLLAFGADKQAENILNQKDYGPDSSGLAWLFMARRWVALGDWDGAEFGADYSVKNHLTLNNDEYQEAQYILALSMIEQAQLQRARKVYAKMKKSGIWADLTRVNLLVALIESSGSIHFVQKIANEANFYQRKNDESRALADRSFLLAGLYMLEQEEYAKAQKFFEKIRINGPYTADGLLQHGWSLAKQSKYPEALQPWRVLQKNYDNWHPAIVESLVAVPHIMELMGASTQALRGYELVDERVSMMRLEVQSLSKAEYLNGWLKQWLASQQGDWGWRRHQLEFQDDKATKVLLSLLSSAVFNSQLTEYYDLQQLNQQLAKQYQDAELWRAMLLDKQAMLKRVQGEKRLHQLQERKAALLVQVQELKKRWEQQQHKQFPYTTPKQQQLLQQFEGAAKSLKKLQDVNKPSRNLNHYEERLRRSNGIFLWEAAYDQSEREWEATSEFLRLDHALNEMDVKLKHAQLALEWSALDWGDLDAQIQTAQMRILEQQSKVQNLQELQLQYLVDQVIAYLEVLDERLIGYQSSARLAIARLYDDALQEQVGEQLEQQARTTYE